MIFSDLSSEDRYACDRILALGWVGKADLLDRIVELRRLRQEGHAIPLIQVLLHQGLLSGAQYVTLASDLRRKSPGPSMGERSTRIGRGSLLPCRLGPYWVMREIGRGGMATIFAAVDIRDDDPVALKVVRESGSCPDAASRLQREAVTAAHLRHPNIVAVREIGHLRQPPGEWIHYLAMEYVEGEVLGRRIGTRERNEVLDLVTRLAEVVAFVHFRRYVHLDLKPDNVLVRTNEEIVLADFGMATRWDDEGPVEIRGTPAYMAPEQVLGEGFDPRTDVYALGVILYEVLTGRIPFCANGWEDLRDQVVSGRPPSPREIDSNISESLERVCLRAMAKRPGERYPSALAFARELEAAASRALDANFA